MFSIIWVTFLKYTTTTMTLNQVLTAVTNALHNMSTEIPHMLGVNRPPGAGVSRTIQCP